ncbi:MAG: glycosyltransferase [Rickettsiales bacterium]|jgi:glycosyltransferase involved in cell wall biosynthesis/exopolysaccharide biosynthesis predicted pyruvyltransferase EpsI|nr:glycosyltransferase [Rickettsiales bacterium]
MGAKISVIIPVYNVEKYIRECLDSVVGQTLADIEIVLVDDFGTDGSMEIAREFAAKDGRIKIITHEKNGGLSAARNTGMKNSSAPYIMFCDSDDFYEPAMCEKMLDAIESVGADVAVCGTNVIYEANRDQRRGDRHYFAVRGGARSIDADLMFSTSVCAWNKIWRRGIIESRGVLFPRGLKFEDEYFWHAYGCWAKTAYFVSDRLYNYRRRPGGIMSNVIGGSSDGGIDCVGIAAALREYLKNRGLLEKKQEYFWRFFLNRIISALHRVRRESHGKVYDMADDFIRRENLPMGSLPANMRRQFEMLERRTLLGEKRILLGGLIKIKKSPKRWEAYFAGIPVWRVRYTGGGTKYYLLRFIRVFHKSPTKFKPALDARNFSPFSIDDGALLAELKKSGEFAYVPNSGNMGDMLIASATMRFFERNKIRFAIHDGRHAPDSVVFSGGAVWIKDYKEAWPQILAVFARAKRVVILPSSFNDCRKLVDAMDERFVVFCREKQSYDYLTEQNTGSKIILDHDMAFRATKGIFGGKIRMTKKERKALNKAALGLQNAPRVARFIRGDCESTGKYETGFDLSAVAYSTTRSTRRYIDFGAKLMLCAVDSVDAVITDRLHVGIAGALMGKEVYLLDNSYGKVSAVYRHSMSGNPRVHFCEEMPDISKINPPHTATDNLKRL